MGRPAMAEGRGEGGARATRAMDEVPIMMFVLPISWPPMGESEAGVAITAAGRAMEVLPMKMAEAPTEMSVLSMVKGAAPGVRIVPAMAMPPAMAVIVWFPRVATGDTSGWNWPPAFRDCDGGSVLLLTLLAGSAGFEAWASPGLLDGSCCSWKVRDAEEGIGWLPPFPVLIG